MIAAAANGGFAHGSEDGRLGTSVSAGQVSGRVASLTEIGLTLKREGYQGDQIEGGI
jgi:hypothetical protein